MPVPPASVASCGGRQGQSGRRPAKGLARAAEADKIVAPLAESWFTCHRDPAAYQKARARLADLIVSPKPQSVWHGAAPAGQDTERNEARGPPDLSAATGYNDLKDPRESWARVCRRNVGRSVSRIMVPVSAQ